MGNSANHVMFQLDSQVKSVYLPLYSEGIEQLMSTAIKRCKGIQDHRHLLEGMSCLLVRKVAHDRASEGL